MREDGRWQLTDFQRLLVVLIVVISMFLGAMAWGWGRLELALVSLFLLVGAGLAVFLLGMRYSSRVLVPGTAEVISATPPPRRGLVGRCDLQLLVDLPGRGRTRVRLRPQVDVTRWPRTGMLLPVQVSGRGHVQVRWNQVDARRAATAAPAFEPDLDPVPGYNAPFYTDYRDDAFETRYAAADPGGSPLSGAMLDDDPPVSTTTIGPDPGRSDGSLPDDLFDGDAYLAGPYADPPFTDPTFADPPYSDQSFADPPFDDPSFVGRPYTGPVYTADPVYTSGPDPDPYFPGPYGYPGESEPFAAGPFPDTSYREQRYPDEPFDIEAYPEDLAPPRQRTGEPPESDATTTLHTGLDDAPVDVHIYRPERTDTRLRPVDGDGSDTDLLTADERARTAGFELPLPRRERSTAAEPTIVEPVPVEPAVAEPGPAEVVDVEATESAPDATHSAAATEAISVLLVVSDVDRSVAFYRDKLGFTVEDQTAGGAILSHGGGPIVLQRLTDMAPVDRRVVLLRLLVPDVEAAYQRLKEQGVEFAQKPGWIRVGRQDVMAAKLHDPDGHAIQLVEGWRRGNGPPPR